MDGVEHYNIKNNDVFILNYVKSTVSNKNKTD